MSFRVEAVDDLIVTAATGRLTDGEILAHMKRLATDPEVAPGMREVCDLSGVTELAVTSAGVKQFISFDRTHTDRRGRLALVASTDEVFGMARMYQTRVAGDRVGVFRTTEEARSWLGLPSA